MCSVTEGGCLKHSDNYITKRTRYLKNLFNYLNAVVKIVTESYSMIRPSDHSAKTAI